MPSPKSWVKAEEEDPKSKEKRRKDPREAPQSLTVPLKSFKEKHFSGELEQHSFFFFLFLLYRSRIPVTMAGKSYLYTVQIVEIGALFCRNHQILTCGPLLTSRAAPL